MSYFSSLGPLGSADEAISPMLQRGLSNRGLFCPNPVKAEAKLKATKPHRKVQGHAWPLVEGEAGHEILDILFSKVTTEDAGSPNRSMCYLLGSPPVRAGNPLIHDVHFTQDRVSKFPPKSPPYKPLSVGKSKAACGASRVPAPRVRIEGFVSSAVPDSQSAYKLRLTRCVTQN